jgi:hypothetical protein
MTIPQMKFLNLILCSKNDNYCGKPIKRLELSLNENIKILSKYQNWKIHVVDWGSDVKIGEEINVKHDNLNFYYIPKNITGKINSPFSEVHALNYAARKCNEGFIGRIDQDTFIGEKFAKWFFSHSDENEFYFGRRSDLPPNELDITKSVNLYQHFPAHDCAVGILLMHYKLWHDSTGYNEKNIYFNHMEREFIFRLKQKNKFVDLLEYIGSDFYHIWHEQSQKQSNQLLSIDQLSMLDYKCNNFDWGLLDC